ncbi:hypothetical protein DWW99_11795 [[Clostridium] leptum]|nr:hypothetical protein DWW99_11795 [[Clostridium] leptum]
MKGPPENFSGGPFYEEIRMSTVLLIEVALCRGTASGQGQAFGGAFYGKARNADCGGVSPKKRREKTEDMPFSQA